MVKGDSIDKSHSAYRRELGDGLVLRWSHASDAERIGELYSFVFRDAANEEPNTFIATWVRDLMIGTHPLITPNDFALVEDTRSGAIVAATCLLKQTWDYGGIAFPVARPEVVATMPEYRNRGLIRSIFDLIHARSDGRGDMAQGITGIPYYYRQFGYEFALDLGGSRATPFSTIPKLKDGEVEPYTLRDATIDDVQLLLALYERERTRQYNNTPLLVSTRLSAEYWQFLISGGIRVEAAEGWRTHLIVSRAGQPVGYVLTRPIRANDGINVAGLSVEQGVSLAGVLPSVMRALQELGPSIPLRYESVPPPGRITFNLGRWHPVYEALGMSQDQFYDPPYAWYVRVPDLPSFIRHIAPVLNRRLADSVMSGYSGDLRITFYRGGLRMVFEDGRVVQAEPWRTSGSWGTVPHAGFPPLVFLQLLFGHRSLAELRSFLPDVRANDDGRRLLDALFPKTLSWVIALE